MTTFSIDIDPSYEQLNLSTRLISGGQVTAVPGTTYVTIAGGVGQIVDNYTNPADPKVYNVTWPTMTNVQITNITTQPQTWIALDRFGDVQQFLNTSASNIRNYIHLGICIHSNLSTISTVFQETTVPAIDVAASLFELSQMLQPMSRQNFVSANGANLKLNKTQGELFQIGLNWFTDRSNPNRQILPALTAFTFIYTFWNSAANRYINIPGTDINPNYYDDRTAVTGDVLPRGIVGNNNWALHRVYIGINNIIIVRYGEKVYSTKADALTGVSSDYPTYNTNHVGNLTLIATVGCAGQATSLLDPTYSFISIQRGIGEP